MADTLKQHGIDINEMFDIERHTFGSTALPMTEYIVRKKETHNA